MCTMVLKTKKSENYSRKEHFLSLTFFYRNNYRILCELLSVRPKIFLEIKFFGLSCSLGGPKAILKLCTKSNASYLAMKNFEVSISYFFVKLKFLVLSTYIWGRWNSSSMHDSTSIGHFIFMWIFTAAVKIHAVDDSEIKE